MRNNWLSSQGLNQQMKIISQFYSARGTRYRPPRARIFLDFYDAK